MAKEINWEKKIEECKSAFDMLKLESEFLDSEKEPNLDNFYVDVWYEKIDSMLGREDQFEKLTELEEKFDKLEHKFNRHDHKDSKVVIEV